MGSKFGKKIIRLTESDLNKIVKRIISEQELDIEELKSKIRKEKQKVIAHFDGIYKSPQTISKFKNKSNANNVISFLSTIKIRPYFTKDKSPTPTANGWVTKKEPDVVNLNVYKITEGDHIYNTILHETAHLIDFYLQTLGEDTVTTDTGGYYDPEDKKDEYVASEAETIARVQRLRDMLDIGVTESKENFSSKIIQAIQSKKMTFGNYSFRKSKNGQFIEFSKPGQKGLLSDLWGFYSVMKINGESQSDISALFANNSIIKDGKVYLNLFKIAKVNANTKNIRN